MNYAEDALMLAALAGCMIGSLITAALCYYVWGREK